MAKELPVTGSPLPAIVDDEWFERLATHKWQFLKKSGYVVRQTFLGRKPDGRRIVRTLYLARVIMGVEWKSRFEIEVDHKDRNKLNNQRENLRFATRVQNIVNKPSKPGSKSKYKGVKVVPAANGTFRYRAAMSVGDRQIHLGSFAIEEEAARAYDTAALKRHGEFAYLNFPEATRASA